MWASTSSALFFLPVSRLSNTHYFPESQEDRETEREREKKAPVSVEDALISARATFQRAQYECSAAWKQQHAFGICVMLSANVHPSLKERRGRVYCWCFAVLSRKFKNKNICIVDRQKHSMPQYFLQQADTGLFVTRWWLTLGLGKGHFQSF